MINKIIVIIFLSLAFCISSYAQNKSMPDSIYFNLNKAKYDTNSINVLIQIGYNSIYNNTDSSILCYKNALRMCEAMNANKCSEAEIIFTQKSANLICRELGTCYYFKGEYNEAINYYLESLNRSKKSKNSLDIAKAQQNLAMVYAQLGSFVDAQKYFEQSLLIYENLNYKSGIANVLNNIGSIYNEQKRYKDAIVVLLKALKIYESQNSKINIASVLNNIGQTYEYLNDYAKTKEYYLKSLKICEELDNKQGVVRLLYSFGALEENQNKPHEALVYYEKSIALATQIKFDKITARILLGMSNCYNLLRAYKQSLQYANEALEIASKNNDYTDIKDCYELLSIIHESCGDYKSSLLFSRKYYQFKDSLLGEKEKRELNTLQIKYDTQRKEREIEKLEQLSQIQELQLTRDRYSLYGLSAVIALVTIIALLVIQRNRLRNERKSVQMEQKLLRSQMNPHFIFNALGAIQSFIQKNKSEEATNYLSKFARLVRLILENSRMDYVSLGKEVKTLENYLQLQQLLFENGFDYTITVDEKIDQENICIPPMLAQPFIENALKHGIAPNQAKGNIHISFKSVNNLILFEVTDNGIGIQKAMELKNINNKDHKSLATEITNERLYNFNKNNKRKIDITIEELKNKMNDVIGTKVTFEIPFRYAV